MHDRKNKYAGETWQYVAVFAARVVHASRRNSYTNTPGSLIPTQNVS